MTGELAAYPAENTGQVGVQANHRPAQGSWMTTGPAVVQIMLDFFEAAIVFMCLLEASGSNNILPSTMSTLWIVVFGMSAGHTGVQAAFTLFANLYNVVTHGHHQLAIQALREGFDGQPTANPGVLVKRHHYSETAACMSLPVAIEHFVDIWVENVEQWFRTFWIFYMYYTVSQYAHDNSVVEAFLDLNPPSPVELNLATVVTIARWIAINTTVGLLYANRVSRRMKAAYCMMRPLLRAVTEVFDPARFADKLLHLEREEKGALMDTVNRYGTITAKGYDGGFGARARHGKGVPQSFTW